MTHQLLYISCYFSGSEWSVKISNPFGRIEKTFKEKKEAVEFINEELDNMEFRQQELKRIETQTVAKA